MTWEIIDLRAMCENALKVHFSSWRKYNGYITVMLKQSNATVF